MLDDMLAELGAALDLVLELVVDDDEVVRRLSGRRTCRHATISGTSTSTRRRRRRLRLLRRRAFPARRRQAGDHRHRLEVYAEQTAPLLDFYADQGMLVGIDATGPVEEVTQRAISALRRFAS